MTPEQKEADLCARLLSEFCKCQECEGCIFVRRLAEDRWNCGIGEPHLWYEERSKNED